MRRVRDTLAGFCDFALYLIIRMNLPYMLHQAGSDLSEALANIRFQWYDGAALVLLAAFRFVSGRFNRKLNRTEKGLAVLFSAVFVFANSYEMTDSCVLVTGSVLLILLAVIEFVLLVAFTFNVCGFLKGLILRINEKEHCARLEDSRPGRLFTDHPFLCSFIFILIAWLPYLVIHYPAAIEFDGYYQIMGVLGEEPFSQRWPVASSAFFGYGFQLGRWLLGSNNAGIFFVSVLQSVICAACLAYTVRILKKIGVSFLWQILAVLAYALLPLFPRYLTAIVKDALYSCFVLAFTASLTLLIHQGSRGEKLTWKQFIPLGGFGFLVCCYRSNGVFIILFCLILSVFYILCRRSDGRVFRGIPIVLSVVGIAFFGYSKGLGAIGIPKWPMMDAWSLPFQQTARYAVHYDSEVTPEEKEAINQVLDYDRIRANYVPKHSDEVKITYHPESKRDMIDYFTKAWFPQLLKHPGIYIEATFNNAEGFIYPLAQISNDNYEMHPWMDKYHYFREVTELNKPEWFLLASIHRLEGSFPLTFILSNCGIQFWFAILLLIYAFRRGKWKGLVMIPSLVGILVCIASPTYIHNGLRYAIPVIYCNFFLCPVICTWKKRKKGGE